MPAITVNLDEGEINYLHYMAAKVKMPPEELLSSILRRLLSGDSNEDFEELAHKLIADDKELLLRLV